MLRWYILIVIAMGLMASMLSRGPSGPAAPSQVIITDTRAPRAADSAQASNVSLDPLDNSIELSRDSNGYFYADVKINGAPLHMLVDTGASGIALSRSDAQMAGIATSIGMNEVVGEGADGAVRGQQVVLQSVTMGDKTVEGLPAIILNSGGQSLLGQSFLSKFASVHIEGDRMILR